MKTRSIIQRSPHGTHTNMIICRPGQSQWLLYKQHCKPFIKSVDNPLPPLDLWYREGSSRSLQSWLALLIILKSTWPVNLMISSHKYFSAVFICVFVYIYCNEFVTNIVIPWTFFCAIICCNFLSSPICDWVYCTAELVSHLCRAAYNRRAKKTEIVVVSTFPIYVFIWIYFPRRPYGHLNPMHQNSPGHQRLV